MSFFTWRWLLPQKLQSSCSLPSLARATSLLVPRNRLLYQGTTALAMRDHVVDDPVVLRLLGGHEVVALHVLGDLVDVLSCVKGDDLLEPPLEADHLARLDLDVGRLTLEAGRDLVDQDLRVRQRQPLPLRPAGEEQRTHAHRDPDADRLHVRLDELHRVVDREAGVHRAPGRVDVERDVLVRVLRLQVQKLRDDQVRDLVIDRSAQENNPLVEQPAVDVERTLASRRLLDDHGDEGAHAGSLLPGVHNFAGVSGVSFPGVQICSRIRARSAGTRLTSAATRSSAARMRRSSRTSSWRPLPNSSSTAASALSPAASAFSLIAALTSSSATSMPSFSATASSVSSRAIDWRASRRRRACTSAGSWPVSSK